MSTQTQQVDSTITHLDSLLALKMLRETMDDIESGRVQVVKRHSNKTMFGSRLLSIELQDVAVVPQRPERPIRFRAEHTCRLPSGSFACCKRHLKHLERMARQLCIPIHVSTIVEPPAECTYCVSEADAKPAQIGH